MGASKKKVIFVTLNRPSYHPKLNPDPDPEKTKNHNPDPNPKQHPDYTVFKMRIRLRCTPLVCSTRSDSKQIYWFYRFYFYAAYIVIYMWSA